MTSRPFHAAQPSRCEWSSSGTLTWIVQEQYSALSTLLPCRRNKHRPTPSAKPATIKHGTSSLGEECDAGSMFGSLRRPSLPTAEGMTGSESSHRRPSGRKSHPPGRRLCRPAAGATWSSSLACSASVSAPRVLASTQALGGLGDKKGQDLVDNGILEDQEKQSRFIRFTDASAIGVRSHCYPLPRDGGVSSGGRPSDSAGA